MGNAKVEDEAWQRLSRKQQCRSMKMVAQAIASNRDELIRLCQSPWRTDPVETITAELFPLCAALKWIATNGHKTLASRKVGLRGRPVWLWGVRSETLRIPHGDVLILAAWNYPLFLPGVQAAQALAAGNRVLLKPAPGCESVTQRLAECFYHAGVSRSSLRILDSDTQSAIDAMEAGVDLVVLTGAAKTGRKVMAKAAESLTPSIMELSGCDAVIVLPGADVKRAADAICFGLTFNSGATCIAPRRIIAENSVADPLVELLKDRLCELSPVQVHPVAVEDARSCLSEAIQNGAKPIHQTATSESETASCIDESGWMPPTILDHVEPSSAIANADLFAPISSILRVESTQAAIDAVNDCPYRLAAAVFGATNSGGQLDGSQRDSRQRDSAEEVAKRLRVGTVVVNDLIVPTADPRLPFGGHGNSGFGVTRGPEGLLAMTKVQVISRRRGRFMPHLKPQEPGDESMLSSALALFHGSGLRTKVAALARMIKRS